MQCWILSKEFQIVMFVADKAPRSKKVDRDALGVSGHVDLDMLCFLNFSIPHPVEENCQCAFSGASILTRIV